MKVTRVSAGESSTLRLNSVSIFKSRLWKNKIGRRVATVIAILLSLWLIAWGAAHWIIVSAPLDHADAIVVLSGSSTIPERTKRAAQLYQEQKSKKILLTRDTQRGSWSQAEQRNPYYYESAVAELKRQRVPDEAIEVVGPPVNSTWDEAITISDYVAAHNVHSVLLVTSSYHSRRALWTFRRHLNGKNIQVGIDPVETGVQTPRPAVWWLSIKGWQVVFLEYLKLIYYCCRRS
jgi:uncharacterized SAM-binding protein YcdF (DUF218 family)